jgi:hypothetical protein
VTATRCAHRARRPPVACLSPDLGPVADESAPATAAPTGRFVQLLAGEIARFTTAASLTFDQVDVLVHLLLVADHRTGTVPDVNKTKLARQLGRSGPAGSGRRTVGEWLDRLAAVGAVRSPTTMPGPVEVLVYRQLVHGPDDPRRGFVQLVPGAVVGLADRHGLSSTGRALLVRLLLLADPRTHSLAALDLGSQVGLSSARLQAGLDELVATGLIDFAGGSVFVCAYSLVVRPSTPTAITGPTKADDRAPQPPKRAVPGGERAVDGSAARGSRNPSPAREDPDHTQDGETTPPSPRQPPAAPAGVGRGWDLVAEIGARLTEGQRSSLHTPADGAVLLQLATDLERLSGGGWAVEALVSHLAAPLPTAVRSVARLLLARAKGLPATPPSPTQLRDAAEAARLALEITGAQSYARNQASVPDWPTAEIAGGLARSFTGEALEAGLAALAAIRPDVDLEAVRGLTAVPRNHEPESEARPRRDGASSPEPVGIGQLLHFGDLTTTIEGRGA